MSVWAHVRPEQVTLWMIHVSYLLHAMYLSPKPEYFQGWEQDSFLCYMWQRAALKTTPDLYCSNIIPELICETAGTISTVFYFLSYILLILKKYIYYFFITSGSRILFKPLSNTYVLACTVADIGEWCTKINETTSTMTKDMKSCFVLLVVSTTGAFSKKQKCFDERFQLCSEY